ncbi:MAG: hypothetical protein ACRDCE_22810 [Cetobacterium sp.]|uniref:hypothetical protein n=1 Tax=Cetobacterium sp. TaxID=2071632 RepID=UPI003EE6AD78
MIKHVLLVATTTILSTSLVMGMMSSPEIPVRKDDGIKEALSNLEVRVNTLALSVNELAVAVGDLVNEH